MYEVSKPAPVSDLVVLTSLSADEMYSDSLFSIKATLIQARPCSEEKATHTEMVTKAKHEKKYPLTHKKKKLCKLLHMVAQDSFILTFAFDDRTFSMLSMLRMQLCGTLLQAALM